MCWARATDPGHPGRTEVVATIDHYLGTQAVRAGRHSPTGPLFVRRLRGDDVPFNRQAMDDLVADCYRRAGVTPPPGSLARALCHTYATLLVDAGASLPEVQRLLGHVDVSTNKLYLEVAGRGLEEAALSTPARALLGPSSPRGPRPELTPHLGDGPVPFGAEAVAIDVGCCRRLRVAMERRHVVRRRPAGAIPLAATTAP